MLIENVFRYNLYYNNSINLYLNNLLLSNPIQLPKIFYKLVFKYVDVKYIYLFMEDLMNLSFGIVNYRQLADKLCFIDKTIINSNFRYYNFMYGKANLNNEKMFLERYKNNFNISCLKYVYYDNVLHLFKEEEDVMYEILTDLYNLAKDKIIINYMVYYKFFHNIDDKTIDSIKKKITNTIFVNKDTIFIINSLYNTSNQMFKFYYDRKKRD